MRSIPGNLEWLELYDSNDLFVREGVNRGGQLGREGNLRLSYNVSTIFSR